ncbi:MAG: winged helix-turn-helix domain-containing protein [Tetrasphaera sp.]
MFWPRSTPTTARRPTWEIAAYVAWTLLLPPTVTERQHKEGAALTELEYRLQWTRTYLRQSGLIDSTRRGHWLLTPAGWQTETVDPAEVVRAVRSQMRARAVEKGGQAPIFPGLAVEQAPRSQPVASAPGLRSPTPLLPTYTNARHFLRILDGVSAAAYLGMASAIWDQRGNPREQVDWSDPDAWIAARLDGDNRMLALRLWHDSQRQLNPRYTRGCWYFAARHDLLSRVSWRHPARYRPRPPVRQRAGGAPDRRDRRLRGRAHRAATGGRTGRRPAQHAAAQLQRLQPQPDDLPERQRAQVVPLRPPAQPDRP